jgi:beta-lactamase regulating signal transducer with metallopeptidase domain
MTIGFSLFAIAVGAILKLAVSTQVAGITIVTVGVILMVVGAIGLIVGLWVIRSGRAAPEI